MTKLRVPFVTRLRKEFLNIMSKKKFILPLTVFALLISFGLSACDNNNGEQGGGQESQQTSEDKPSSAKQEKINVTATDNKTKLIYPDTVQLIADQDGVTWESAKPEIATVSATGLVTAVSKGSASIKAIKEGFKDGSINISVDYPSITVSAADNKTNLLIDETVTLTASEQGVTWSSSDATVASVEGGVVTAKKLGTAVIKASKDKFNDGSVTINVVRPEPTATLHMEDADHYSADGEWTNSNRGPGETPIYSKSSASDGTCVGYFGEGDKETLTFTSTAAVKAEITVSMGHNSSYEPLSQIMSAKFNNVDIDLSAVNFISDSDGQGNYSFHEISFGELDLVVGNNVLEISLLGNAPYLDDVKVYAGSAATIAVVPAPEKPAIVITNLESELTIEEGATVQLASETTGLSYETSSEAVATVSDTGLVTGVARGSATITIRKDGYKTAKVTITVIEKVVAGEIKVEAETGTSENDAVTFRQVSSGETATDTFPEGATLIIKFDVTTAGTYVLSMDARGNSSRTAIDLAAGLSAKFNDEDVAISGSLLGRTFQKVIIGEVTAKVGENILAITALSGTRPNIDFFKLTPKA